MRRALFVLGWAEAPAAPPLREFSVLAVHRLPGRSFGSWQDLARRLDVELSASWLLAARGAPVVAPEVRAGFRGCLEGVEPRQFAVEARRLDREASGSLVITDFQTARRRSERWRRAGKRLVFTNGVFDVLHVGHLRLLEAARAQGDALVVGINTDESARLLKGDARPAVPQFARAEAVAALRTVDLCVIFPQPDPRELLRAVKPHVLVKGSEYTLAQVVGRELVESWGGRVWRAPHVPGWSSTAVLRKGRKV